MQALQMVPHRLGPLPVPGSGFCCCPQQPEQEAEQAGLCVAGGPG